MLLRGLGLVIKVLWDLSGDRQSSRLLPRNCRAHYIVRQEAKCGMLHECTYRSILSLMYSLFSLFLLGLLLLLSQRKEAFLVLRCLPNRLEFAEPHRLCKLPLLIFRRL